MSYGAVDGHPVDGGHHNRGIARQHPDGVLPGLSDGHRYISDCSASPRVANMNEDSSMRDAMRNSRAGFARHPRGDKAIWVA